MTVCNRPLYARPEDATVKCRCGATYQVKDKREEMLDALKGEAFPIREIARIAAKLGNFPDTPVTERRLNLWAHRETIEPVGVDIEGRPTYKLTVVLDLLEEKFGKKPGEAVA